jgi:hypothetical protein
MSPDASSRDAIREQRLEPVRGPVYPGLGGSGGMLYATPDVQYGGPWAGGKVFLYVRPSYRGRVLIRGRRLDGPQWPRFNGRRVPRASSASSPMTASRGKGSHLNVTGAGLSETRMVTSLECRVMAVITEGRATRSMVLTGSQSASQIGGRGCNVGSPAFTLASSQKTRRAACLRFGHSASGREPSHRFGPGDPFQSTSSWRASGWLLF